MAKAFGSWLRDYSGENTRLQHLSKKWVAHLRMDYVPANQFHLPSEVYLAMAQSYGECPKLERLIHLAREVHRNRLTTTKSRFLSKNLAYRPDPDVPTWPPIWE